MNWRAPRRLRFTREGKILTGMSLAVGFAAVNTGNNLLYLVLGWSLAFIVASGVLSERTLRGLVLRCEQRGPLFADTPGVVTLEVHNSKPAASYSVTALVAKAPAYFLRIGAGETQRATIPVQFSTRGRHALPIVRLATKFPFGLFDKSLETNATGDVVVFPRRVPVSLAQLGVATWGELPSKRLGKNGDFFGLRPFRTGDDKRDIHWRSSARQGELIVRELEDAQLRSLTLVVDNANADHLEDVIATAASLISDLLRQGWAVGLAVRGAQWPPDRGAATEHKLLTTLALLPAANPSQPLAGRLTSPVPIVPAQLERWHAART